MTGLSNTYGLSPSPLDVLTLTQAADYLQLSVESVRGEAEAGRLVGRNFGGEWRFVRERIVAWLCQPTRRSILDFPVSDETPEEHAAFMAIIQANRDEVDRATGSGKYAPE